MEKVTQREAAKQLSWPRRRLEKAVKRLGLKTQRTGPRSGPGHPEWKGGRNLDKSGYVLIWFPEHPNARKNGYVLEHRLVMSKILGRALRKNEVVHHKNGVKDDNRPSNLELFSSNAEHLAHELKGRVPKWTPAGKARILAAVRSRGSRQTG